MENNIQQTDQLNSVSSTASSSPSKAFIILLVAMLIVIVGVGGYTLGIKQGKTIVQNQQATVSPTVTQPSTTPTTDPTANWKTYTNTIYGYQISYPNVITLSEEKEKVYFYIEPQAPQINLSIEATHKTNTSLEKLVSRTIDSYCCDIQKEQSNFNGLKAVKAMQKIIGPETMETYIEYLVFVKEDIEYVITVTSGGEINANKKILIDQILSTFKFTDQNQYPRPTRDFSPVIEEEGKLKVQNTPEVKTLIGKYGKSNVSIKALDVKLVKDIQFIMQLDPKFKEETGCIIVVESNNSGYVYQLDKDNDVLYRQTLEEFKQKTANVDQQILDKFYSSLS